MTIQRTTARITFKARPERLQGAKVRIALAMALLSCLCAVPAHANSIRLHDEVGVTDGTVKLRQVAELIGDHAEGMGDHVVGRFVGDSDELVIQLDDVRRALSDADVNWGMVSLRGYQRCRVHRLDPRPEPSADGESAAESNTEQRITPDQSPRLRGRVESVIQQLAGVPRDELRITFNERDAEQLDRSAWAGRYEIEPRTSRAIGRVLLSVRRYEAGKPVERFTIAADVQRRAEVVIVTRHLSRGDRFTGDALKQRTVWLDDDRLPLNDVSLVADQQAASTMNTDDYVYASDVRSPILIQRGELVTVRCLSGNLVLRTVGRAAEDGAMDEVIRIRNEGSRETFRATVTGRLQAVVQLDKADASLQSAQAGDER
ncbi:MAG: flagellar basal body P-ring formation chaperone FlgA [Phycisphaeraceae bacterium]